MQLVWRDEEYRRARLAEVFGFGSHKSSLLWGLYFIKLLSHLLLAEPWRIN
jgi:hypothetical protein